jgi:nitroimidazol reductase NimA-like FMN-containing flavoprotein (pyridoxamine 5'-phosphate oxidase superfamily)
MMRADGRLAETPRTTLRRRPARGSRDRATIDAIIDQSLVCHVGFLDEGSPAVMPTCPWRIDGWLYVHGAANSRLLARFAGGEPLCVSLALIDGLVLARSALRHSLHYRSVVLFGRGEAVVEPAAKAAALLALIDKLSPGRSAMVRPPGPEELAATGVARMCIAEGTAKIAASPPGATDADQSWSVWDGIVPLRQRAAAPVPMVGAENLAAPALQSWLA